MNEIFVLPFALFIALILSGIFVVPYKICANNCEKTQITCTITEKNTTRLIPNIGEKINCNGAYIDTYWVISSSEHPDNTYAIDSWNNNLPIPGIHACNYHRNKYVSLDICKVRCMPQF